MMSSQCSILPYCRMAVLLSAVLPLAQGFSPFIPATTSLTGGSRVSLIPRTVLFSDVSEPAQEEAGNEQEPVAKRERHTLFVGNLDFETTDSELRDLFSQSGTVELVSMPMNKVTGLPRGFAFVDMSSPEECEKAIESLAGSTFKDRVIRVSKSLPKEDVKKQNFKKDAPPKLYVGNLPFETTKEELIALFEKYGNVRDCFIPVNHDTGVSRGFAFITLDEKESIEKAIEETNGMELDGRPLIVNKPLTRDEKSERKPRIPRKKLYVGNLSFYTVPETLVEVFEEFGEVHDCFLPENPETGGSRGFGFVTLDRDAAEAAIRATDGLELDGRMIQVNEAQSKGSRKGNNHIEGDGAFSDKDGYEP